MITVLAIDALEYTLVEEFNLSNLKQTYYGKTDITEFSQPRTMVLWSSFMTGKNMESKILARGNKKMWKIKIKPNHTFFSKFENPYIIDLPGYNYDNDQHELERNQLKEYFNSDKAGKEKILKNYNIYAFEHHRKIKKEFLKALNENYDFLLGYFSIVDVIGHLNFGNKKKMQRIYQDLDELVSSIKGKLIVLSDHGMKAIGKYGDHSDYGFWSTNFRDLGVPKITDFFNIICSEIDQLP